MSNKGEGTDATAWGSVPVQVITTSICRMTSLSLTTRNPSILFRHGPDICIHAKVKVNHLKSDFSITTNSIHTNIHFSGVHLLMGECWMVMCSDSPCLQGTDGVNLCDAHNGAESFKSSAAAFSHLQITRQCNKKGQQ